MLIYTLNRILHLIPVLFILTIVVFAFVHALPGDVIDTLTSGDEDVTDPEVWLAAIRDDVQIACVTHVLSNTGERLPVRDITTLTRERGTARQRE